MTIKAQICNNKINHMSNFKELTSTGSSQSKITINLDNVAFIQRGETYTTIYFNFSVVGSNGGYIHSISVLETPNQILTT